MHTVKRKVTPITFLVMALALGACVPKVPRATEVVSPSTLVVRETVVVRQSVIVPQTVVVPQTVAVPQTVVVAQTLVVKETVVVTPTPQSVPTAAVVTVTKAAYTLGPISRLRDANGTLRFMVEITNMSGVPLMETRVVLTLRDDGGAVLDTETGASPVDILPPGQKVPIAIVVSQEPKGWTRFDIKATGNVASKVRLEAYSTDLKVLQSKLTADGKQFKVTGEIKNDGVNPVQFAKVVVGLYDSAGRLVGVRDGYAAVSDLAPGETSPFSLDGISVTGAPATLKVWTSARVRS
jgi:hypothetical protein